MSAQALYRRLMLIGLRPNSCATAPADLLSLASAACCTTRVESASLAVLMTPNRMPARGVSLATLLQHSLSLVLGLLGWLGWECEVDRRTLKAHPVEDEALEYDWVSRLTWVLREAVLDEGATAILRETMAGVRRWRSDPLPWLIQHLAWAEALALIESDPKNAPALGRPLQRGDLVRLDMPNGLSTIEYVLSFDESKVYVADPGREDGRAVLRRYATAIDWEGIARGASSVAS